MDSHIIFRYRDGSEITENNVLSFRFRKEAYTPYTSLSANFCTESLNPAYVSEVLFYIDNRLIHHGLIDSLEVSSSHGAKTAKIYSRSFSVMLMQNELAPGLYTNTSVNSLIDSFITIPYVTHENKADTNYIFIKYGSVLWDGITAVSYKLYHAYPYIRGTNHIMCSTFETPENFSYGSDEIISYGSALAERNLLSHFHMEDVNGNYGTYDFNNTEVSDLKIVRHKYFELDKQFLYDPQQALLFRNSYALRGYRKHFCTYCGYKGEDLSDTASFNSISGRISDIVIKGGSDGIFTEISVYKDGLIT